MTVGPLDDRDQHPPLGAPHARTGSGPTPSQPRSPADIDTSFYCLPWRPLPSDDSDDSDDALTGATVR